MNYLGDFPEDATVYIPFNTFDSNDPAASVTVTNLANSDIKVHKDGGTSQIVTDGATVEIDYDSGIVGNHLITIDTSIHADYSTGSDYMVRVEGITVDGGTINAWVGSFSIENRYTRGTNSANTVVPDVAGTAQTIIGTAGASLTNINLPNQVMDITGDITGNVSGSVGSVTGHTVQTGDSYARIGAAGAALTGITGAQLAADQGVDVTKINGSANAAARLALSAAQMIPGTVDTVTNSHTPTTTEFQADDVTESTADHYNSRLVLFTTGVLAGQVTTISDYVAVGGIGQFTVVALTEAPTNNDTFLII